MNWCSPADYLNGELLAAKAPPILSPEPARGEQMLSSKFTDTVFVLPPRQRCELRTKSRPNRASALVPALIAGLALLILLNPSAVAATAAAALILLLSLPAAIGAALSQSSTAPDAADRRCIIGPN